MAVVRSLLFALFFYSGSFLAAAAAPLVALAGPGAMRGFARGWMHYHRWCTRHLLGIVARVEGRIPTTPVLVAAKHQSMYETVELALLLGDPAVVVKRELAVIPLWGWAARRYGVIPIDREGSVQALRGLITDARAMAAQRRAILLFPEGTRVAPGERPALRAGFAGLYRALGVPVVPVALDTGRLWPRGGFVKHAGVVTLRFGAPIPPGLPRAEAEARVHAAINALEPAA